MRLWNRLMRGISLLRPFPSKYECITLIFLAGLVFTILVNIPMAIVQEKGHQDGVRFHRCEKHFVEAYCKDFK